MCIRDRYNDSSVQVNEPGPGAEKHRLSMMIAFQGLHQLQDIPHANLLGLDLANPVWGFISSQLSAMITAPVDNMVIQIQELRLREATTSFSFCSCSTLSSSAN